MILGGVGPGKDPPIQDSRPGGSSALTSAHFCIVVPSKEQKLSHKCSLLFSRRSFIPLPVLNVSKFTVDVAMATVISVLLPLPSIQLTPFIDSRCVCVCARVMCPCQILSLCFKSMLPSFPLFSFFFCSASYSATVSDFP